MQNFKNSLFTFACVALCACVGTWVMQPSVSAQKKTNKENAAKEKQKPATPTPTPKAASDDEPVAITPRTTTAAPVEITAKPAATLGPNQYGNFRYPMTNNKGQVAFVTVHQSAGPTPGVTQSIVVANPDGTWQVIPETEKIINLKDDFSSINNLTINGNGDLTFTAQLAGKTPLPENPNAPNRDQFIQKSSGLFVKTAEGVKVVLRLGEEVPLMPSFFSGIANASSNSKGTIAFIGTYTDPDGKGLFIYENGKARLIARSGQKILPGDDRVFSEHYYPGRINENGDIAWLSRVGSEGGGIFVLRNGKIELLAMQGKPAPVATQNGQPATTTYKDAEGKERTVNFIGFGNRSPSINDKGDVVFAAFYDGPEYGRALFMKPADGPLRLVAKSGDTISGMTANFTDFNFPTINNKGEIAFLGNYGGRARGVFIKKGAAIEPVAMLDQKLPNGKPEELMTQFIAPVINDRGEVYFYGQMRNSDVAIFQWDEAKGLRTLARRGGFIANKKDEQK